MRTIITSLVLLLLIVFGIGCQNKHKGNMEPVKQEGEKRYQLLPASVTGLDFSNTINENAGVNGIVYEYLYNGGGVAAGDFNGDKLPDLYFTANLSDNALYLNKGDLKFQKVTAQAKIQGKKGFPTGVTTVDINADGRLDIYISKSGKYDDLELRRNELYINMGNNKDGVPVFEERAAEYGLNLPDHSTQAAFFDYDRDGDLDMFLLNHNTDPGETEANLETLLHLKATHTQCKLFRNDDNHFVDVSSESGIMNNGLSYGLGVAISDFNNDQWPDILVGMDYSEKDYLYLNQGNGTFKDVMNQATNHVSNFSMGNDVADLNNDGFMDFISVDMVSNTNYDLKTNMSGMNPKRFYGLVDKGLHHQYMFNTVQLNQGMMLDNNRVPTFSDIAQFSNLATTNWSWAPLFFDMDNDGWQDLFVSNGVLRSFRNNDFVQYKRKRVAKLYEDLEEYTNRDSLIANYYDDLLKVMPEKKEVNLLYINNSDYSFSEKSKAWDLEVPTATNGAIYVDLDNDGDLDIVGNNSNDPASIYKNNSCEGGENTHFLTFKFKGSSQNTMGIGTKVTLLGENQQQTKELYVSRGFQSAVEPALHFGLGSVAVVPKIVVTWPDGKQQILSNLKADQTLLVDYQEAKNQEINQLPDKSVAADFVFETDPMLTGFTHKENTFDDFKTEILLPHRYSQNGPALAVGDVDNDGLDDFFVGGAMGQPATLFLQKMGGGFEAGNNWSWQQDKDHEDLAAEFFDADNDGDLDLYVVSGGNEKEVGDAYYQDRFYENKGEGVFVKNVLALPRLTLSGSCVRSADFDGDGDVDLFVGGRIVPGQYPRPASSKIFSNESTEGKIQFVDVTEAVAPFLTDFGMVTDAKWADLDGDTDLDLLVSGEWMPITVLENREGHFYDNTPKTVLSKAVGWWYSLALADFDGDGDLDIIAGNLGKNYKYKASQEAPFEVYANDFDQNGSLDIVLGYHEEGKVYPLRGRQCSSDQMPFIKKKFPTYNEFGSADLTKVYGAESLQASLQYQANTFASVYIENQGDFTFLVKELPVPAQFSSVNGIAIDDVNADGHWDAVLAGNLYQAEVETPRNDASYGLTLFGHGDGTFRALFPYESGLFVKGDVKQVRKLVHASTGNKYMLFAKNDAPIQFVQYH